MIPPKYELLPGLVVSSLLVTQGWLFSACAVLFVSWVWTLRARQVSGIPKGPYWTPFLGTLPAVMKNRERLLDFYSEMVDPLKPGEAHCVCAAFQAEPLIRMCPDPKVVQHIFKDNFANYVISERRIERFKELSGNGILAVNGAAWRPQRKAASHMFTANFLKGPVMEASHEHLATLMHILEANCASEKYFDSQDLFMRYMMDCFMQLSFGECENILKSEQLPEFLDALQDVQSMLRTRFVQPWWKISRFLNVGPEKKLRKLMAVLDNKAYEIIRRRRQKQMTEKDLIGCYLNQAAKDGEVLSDVFLRDMVLNFLVAGRDSTATLLSWVFYELQRNPDVEAKVLQEIDEAVGTLSSRDEPYTRVEFSQIQNLPYLEAVLYETLRLYPPAAIELRQAVEDDVLPNGVRVPAGTSVDYSPWLYGRSKYLWGPEPLKFDPSRFSAPNTLPDQWELPVFNAGMRICLGKGLALLEAKLVIATLMQKYVVRMKPGHDTSYALFPVLGFKHGYVVKLERRL